MDEENAYFSSIDGVLFNEEQTTLLAYPNSKGSMYVIPDHVTTIADNAFYACESLTKVTLPDHLTTVGTEAFANCVKLTAMTFPADIDSIGEYAFRYVKITVTYPADSPTWAAKTGQKYGSKELGRLIPVRKTDTPFL